MNKSIFFAFFFVTAFVQLSGVAHLNGSRTGCAVLFVHLNAVLPGTGSRLAAL